MCLSSSSWFPHGQSFSLMNIGYCNASNYDKSLQYKLNYNAHKEKQCTVTIEENDGSIEER